MPLEQYDTYNGYVYGGPNQGTRREIEPYPAPAPAPQVSTSNPGCLGFVLGSLVMAIHAVWEYRKELVRADVRKYEADRNLESVIAQVTGRLEDTREHLKHGIAPGVTLSDIDRTSWGVSQPAQPANSGASVSMNGYNYSRRGDYDPFDADIEIEPDAHSYRENDA